MVQLWIHSNTNPYPPILIVSDEKNGVPTMSYDTNGYLSFTTSKVVSDLSGNSMYRERQN